MSAQGSAAQPAAGAVPPENLETQPVRFRLLPVLLTAAAALAVELIPFPGLTPAAHRTLVILTAVAGLWMTEALPVAITALLVPVLGIILGVADARAAFAGFGDPIVFLFFGTFLLTAAAEEHGLVARLTGSVLGSDMLRRHPARLLWAVAFLGCGLSAWMNNTATTAMLLPLALTAERMGSRKLTIGVLLMCAYAPSLGGLATPVGTAPNLIGLRLLEQATGQRPSFAQWCITFAPLAILATVLTAFWLRRGTRDARPAQGAAIVTPRGLWTLAERTLVPLYVVVELLWIAPGILAGTPLQGAAWLRTWQARLPEPAVPMVGAIALFLLPSGAPGGARILDITVLRRIDWSTLLIFGGGLSLGAMMFESGLARALGEGIFRAMPFGGTYGIVVAATLMAVLVSEMTSNTASASLVVPVVLALAQAAGVDPVKPTLAATVACSFGFMLPVSTPPNALVFATGRVRIREMIAYGVLLDIGGVLLVSGWVTLFG
jgi:sodium-dependent dicarboxylate transporter 2/3/5